jgi:ribonuclease HI
MKKLRQIKIYTDGGCLGNPGPGGYGAVLLYNKHRKELSGGFRLTTNNRMELTAVVEGLKALKYPCQVALYSDSQYVVDAINKGWLVRWRNRNWKKSNKEPVKNIDLWQKVWDLCQKHQVTFIWVKGHAGNAENERCDQLAMQAASQPNLPADINYEREHVI